MKLQDKIFFLGVCLFLGNPLFATTATSSIQNQVTAHILNEFPFLTTADVVVQIKNESILDNYENMELTLMIPEKASLLGFTMLPIEPLPQMEEAPTAHVRLWVEAEVNFLAPVRYLPKGTVLSTENVKEVRYNLRDYPRDAYRDIDAVLGMETTTGVPENAVLTTRVIRKRPDAHYGDPVVIFVSKDAIEFRIKGRLLDDCRIGENVKVRALWGQKKVYEGVLVDSETVQVKFTHL